MHRCALALIEIEGWITLNTFSIIQKKKLSINTNYSDLLELLVHLHSWCIEEFFIF